MCLVSFVTYGCPAVWRRGRSSRFEECQENCRPEKGSCWGQIGCSNFFRPLNHTSSCPLHVCIFWIWSNANGNTWSHFVCCCILVFAWPCLRYTHSFHRCRVVISGTLDLAMKQNRTFTTETTHNFLIARLKLRCRTIWLIHYLSRRTGWESRKIELSCTRRSEFCGICPRSNINTCNLLVQWV